MSMKKKLISSLMLSTVVLASLSQVTPVFATSTSDLDKTIQSAQSGADAAKAQYDSLQSTVDSAKSQLQQLNAEQATNSKQILTLKQNILERQASLNSQARSAQINGGATTYIDAILNSKSLTDAVQKITAMTQVVSANSSMMKQQQADEKSIEQTLQANKQKYAQATSLANQLTQQQADLKVAQLGYQATITTATNQKNELLAQESSAAVAAQKIAQQQSAASAAAASSAAVASAAIASAAITSASVSTPSSAAPTPSYSATPTPAPSSSNTYTPSVSTSSTNPYPYGQCTWGVWEVLGGHMPTYSGNAGDWVVYANASSPAAGEIVVFPAGVDGAGGYGHVAVVTSVNSNGSFNIIESNFNNGINTSRTIPSAAGCYFIIP